MITSSLTLSTEQQDALDGVVALRNSQLPEGSTPYTAESHLAELIMGHIDAAVSSFYEQAIGQLGEGAKTLSYEARKGLIAQVKAQIDP